jgi:hypothetical protein
MTRCDTACGLPENAVVRKGGGLRGIVRHWIGGATSGPN